MAAWTVSRRSVVAAALAGVAVAAYSRGSGDGTEPRPFADAADCSHRPVFAGLAEVIDRVSLCPTWLPYGSGAKVLTSHASEDPPAYTVELGPIHIVLSFGTDEFPGDELEPLGVHGRPAKVHFNAPDGGQPGLHSGHYVLELPAPTDSRGVYSVSLHGIPWQSRQQNVRTLVRIAEALAPVPGD